VAALLEAACHSVHERLSVSQLELLTEWVLEIVDEAS